jgi:2'-5' RNA ligase
VPKKVRDLASEFRELLGVELAPYGDGVKWTGAEQIHLTLKFLGEVETGRIDGVKEAVKTAAKATKPFTLTATGFGAFPSPSKARVLWVGVNNRSDSSEELIALHKKLDAELHRAGFPCDDRPFSPHITIGRIKTGEARNAVARGFKKLRSYAPVDFEVASVVVFKSTLNKGSAVHTPLSEEFF